MTTNQILLIMTPLMFSQTAQAGVGASAGAVPGYGTNLGAAAELDSGGSIACSAVRLCNSSDTKHSYYLSAAHCAKPKEGPPPDTVTINKVSQQVVSRKANPKFNGGGGAAGDFSVFVTDSPPDDTECCELPDANAHAGAQFTLAGYGASSPDEAAKGPPPKESKDLKANPVSLESGSTSQAVLKVRGNKSNTACEGDSGGPIFSKVGGKCVVYGVVSGPSAHDGSKCGSGVEMASTMHEAAWINEQLGHGGGSSGSASSTTVTSVITIKIPLRNLASYPIESRRIDMMRCLDPTHRLICTD